MWTATDVHRRSLCSLGDHEVPKLGVPQPLELFMATLPRRVFSGQVLAPSISWQVH